MTIPFLLPTDSYEPISELVLPVGRPSSFPRSLNGRGTGKKYFELALSNIPQKDVAANSFATANSAPDISSQPQSSFSPHPSLGGFKSSKFHDLAQQDSRVFFGSQGKEEEPDPSISHFHSVKNPSIDECLGLQKPRPTKFEALKLSNVLSGRRKTTLEQAIKSAEESGIK